MPRAPACASNVWLTFKSKAGRIRSAAEQQERSANGKALARVLGPFDSLMLGVVSVPWAQPMLGVGGAGLKVVLSSQAWQHSHNTLTTHPRIRNTHTRTLPTPATLPPHTGWHHRRRRVCHHRRSSTLLCRVRTCAIWLALHAATHLKGFYRLGACTLCRWFACGHTLTYFYSSDGSMAVSSAARVLLGTSPLCPSLQSPYLACQ